MSLTIYPFHSSFISSFVPSYSQFTFYYQTHTIGSTDTLNFLPRLKSQSLYIKDVHVQLGSIWNC